MPFFQSRATALRLCNECRHFLIPLSPRAEPIVQDSQELVPLNLNSGTGNFYLKPNGVFLIDSRGAAIIESSTYRTLPATPRLATQSGPLLLNNGQVNPQFSTNSNSRRIRSGIGVISPDHVVFRYLPRIP